MVTVKSSGRWRVLASQVPMRAPMNPRAIETRHPPRELPPMAWPTDPQIPAITSRRRNSSKVIAHYLHVFQE